MVLTVKSGRAALARPILKGGKIMTAKADLQAPEDTEEKKPAKPPHFLADNRIKVCGKWQKKGYKPTKSELALWIKKCKSQGRDPDTGAMLPKKKAADKK